MINLLEAAKDDSDQLLEENKRLNKALRTTDDLQERYSDTLKRLTTVQREALEAREELAKELNYQRRHQQHEPTAGPTAANWRKRGVDPEERLGGTDPDKWKPWLYSIKVADAPLYNSERKRIVYALSQTSDILFEGMQYWFESNDDNATWEEFLEEAKPLTGVHRLKADAKRELLKITLQHSETVSQYYRRIFKLWQHTETPADERIEKFIRTMRPILSNPLLGRKYTDIKVLLDEARSIEEIKRDCRYTQLVAGGVDDYVLL